MYMRMCGFVLVRVQVIELYSTRVIIVRARDLVDFLLPKAPSARSAKVLRQLKNVKDTNIKQ